jgi:UDP-glucose 4-epimerase
MRENTGTQLIALTGSTGVIGRHLVRTLPGMGYRMRVLLRQPAAVSADTSSAVIGDLRRPGNLAAALSGVSAIIHTAGLPETMTGQPKDDFRDFDAETTRALAEAATRFGVRRFLFLSSLRAQAGMSCTGVLTEDMDPRPSDAYGHAKLKAELVLQQTSIDWAALRLASVYGNCASGAIERLLRLANLPVPLPTAGMRARRSLLALDNLVAAIDLILKSPADLRRPIIVTDPEALSISEMIAALRRGLGRPANQFWAPPIAIRTGLYLLKKSDDYERVAGSLVATPETLMRMGWRPPVETRTGLEMLAASLPGRGV